MSTDNNNIRRSPRKTASQLAIDRETSRSPLKKSKPKSIAAPPSAGPSRKTRSTLSMVTSQNDIILTAAEKNPHITSNDYVKIASALAKSSITRKANLAQALQKGGTKLNAIGVETLLKEFIQDAEKDTLQRVELKRGSRYKLKLNQIPDYEAQSHIPTARGAYGLVRCVKLSTGELVAEKKLTEYSEGIELEIDILNKLRHPHAVELYASFVRESVDGITILSSPWCSCDLKELLRGDASAKLPGLNCYFRRDMRIEFLLGLATCIAASVEYLHAQRIAHNDIKPGNIQFYSDPANRNELPIPKLTDFGCSAVLHLDSTSNSTDRRGRSQFYASPERLSGSDNKNSWRSDVWALALVITEVILKAATIPQGWNRMMNAESGFGNFGPATTLRGDDAVKSALTWILSPCKVAPIPQLLPCLTDALRANPYERGSASAIRKKLAFSMESIGLRPHCGSHDVESSSDTETDRGDIEYSSDADEIDVGRIGRLRLGEEIFD